MRSARSAVSFDMCLPRQPAGSTELPLGAAVESTGRSQVKVMATAGVGDLKRTAFVHKDEPS